VGIDLLLVLNSSSTSGTGAISFMGAERMEERGRRKEKERGERVERLKEKDTPHLNSRAHPSKSNVLSSLLIVSSPVV